MYNCENQIARLIQKSLDSLNSQFDELLVIDNGSTDETLNTAVHSLKSVTIPTKVIQNRLNVSLGGSLKTGFVYAKENSFDFVAVLHGDDQAQLKDMAPIIRKIEEANIDLAIGARFHPESILIGYSRLRKIGNRLLNLYCIICTQRKIADLIAGLNVFKVSKLDLEEILNYPNDLTFDVHILLRAINLKHNIKFFPITWTEEDQISNAKVMRQGFLVLSLFTRYLFKKQKVLKFAKSTDSYKNYKIVFEKKSHHD